MPAYQHPFRSNPRRFDPNAQPPRLAPNLDLFSAVVILTVLRAVAADLGLWTKFVTNTGNENLLFNESDHLDPAGSALYACLVRSSDPDVADWSARLREWAAGPFDRFQTLEQILSDPNADLRKAIAQKNYDRVAALYNPRGRPLPRDLETLVRDVLSKIEVRNRLLAAIASGDTNRIAQARVDAGTLLDDWADC
jgi:hypothetical protein